MSATAAAPRVSILIPAFRPNWLDVAIASALAQTHADFELLISDDSAGSDIESVVSKWDDPRIRYLRNPERGQPGANRNHLIAQARGEYLKFLFDDDFLFPHSLEYLLETVRATGARLAFHARHFVDANGRVLASPSLVQAGTIAVMEQDFFFDRLIGACVNSIGEPTNILLHAETLRSMDSPFHLDGRRMRFLTDVALYTNFAAHGHVMAGVGYFGSAFRQHGEQTSGKRYPGFSAGYYEWELLRRWSVDAGLLSAQGFARGNANMMSMYGQQVAHYPELGAFVALAGAADGERHLSEPFRQALALADTTIEIRKLASVA
jgi:glycosyltransferase involved in cell wall biosynthesis